MADLTVVPEGDGGVARVERRGVLRVAVVAYKERWGHAPVRDMEGYLDWCERVGASAARFNASRPDPGEVTEHRFVPPARLRVVGS